MSDHEKTIPESARFTPKSEAPPMRPPRPPIGVPLLKDGRYALPEGNPCEGCDHCCRYVAIQIPTPRSKIDFDNIRWYILHKNVSVLVTWDGDWMVQFDTPCEWLVDGRCTHYEFRPQVCRDYDPVECERYCTTPAEKILLRTEQDLERYLAERAAKQAARRKARKGAAPATGKSKAARSAKIPTRAK